MVPGGGARFDRHDKDFAAKFPVSNFRHEFIEDMRFIRDNKERRKADERLQKFTEANGKSLNAEFLRQSYQVPSHIKNIGDIRSFIKSVRDDKQSPMHIREQAAAHNVTVKREFKQELKAHKAAVREQLKFQKMEMKQMQKSRAEALRLAALEQHASQRHTQHLKKLEERYYKVAQSKQAPPGVEKLLKKDIADYKRANKEALRGESRYRKEEAKSTGARNESGNFFRRIFFRG